MSWSWRGPLALFGLVVTLLVPGSAGAQFAAMADGTVLPSCRQPCLRRQALRDPPRLSLRGRVRTVTAVVLVLDPSDPAGLVKNTEAAIYLGDQRHPPQRRGVRADGLAGAGARQLALGLLATLRRRPV